MFETCEVLSTSFSIGWAELDSEEATVMNMPGFTAEITLRTRGERYVQAAEGAVASRNRAVVQPALRVSSDGHPPSTVKRRCDRGGGAYWGTGPTTATYGCMFPDGTGIVCDGVHSGDAGTCDTF
jgi:hypothetical protein